MGRPRGPTPSVSAAVIVVLNWWCEETDHTADGICNLLWSHNQLTLTSDPTQLRGLEAMMVAHAPRTPAEYTRDITSLFNSYCKAADAFTDSSKQTQARQTCGSRAHNAMDNLFRVAPASWKPTRHVGRAGSLPEIDPRQMPATTMVEGASSAGASASGVAAQALFATQHGQAERFLTAAQREVTQTRLADRFRQPRRPRSELR